MKIEKSKPRRGVVELVSEHARFASFVEKGRFK